MTSSAQVGSPATIDGATISASSLGSAKLSVHHRAAATAVRERAQPAAPGSVWLPRPHYLSKWTRRHADVRVLRIDYAASLRRCLDCEGGDDRNEPDAPGEASPCGRAASRHLCSVSICAARGNPTSGTQAGLTRRSWMVYCTRQGAEPWTSKTTSWLSRCRSCRSSVGAWTWCTPTALKTPAATAMGARAAMV